MMMNDTTEDKPTGVEELFNKFKDYADTRVNLYKLKAINKVSGVFSTFATMMILMFVFFTVFLCVTFGVAFLIGEWLGASSYGFFIIAALYLIIGLVLYSKRGSILKNPVSDRLIKEMID
ncbi:MAG: hypothetical protein ABJA90_09090 [Ginsengibacter sp.]